MYQLVDSLKESAQDFEFYPTTDEIIFRVASNLKHCQYNTLRNKFSLLDIGAGNGKVLSSINKAFDNTLTCYAIEKSRILKDLLDKGFYIIGTDFLEQSLLDKSIDVTFCNPPYSDFIAWSTKIILESSSKIVYLVLPTRWKESQEIKDALAFREAEAKILGEYSFLNADRSARATVNLIVITLQDNEDDAFTRFFNLEFSHLKTKLETETQCTTDENAKGKFSSLVLGKNYVYSLVEMYNAELANIKKNYQTAATLDPALLKEFEISLSKILTLLKGRLQDLKKTYWHELLSRMKEITSRLTSKKRQSIFDTFNANAHVDFTEGNIYAVVLWLIRNAGQYMDDQLIDVYENAISKANCKNYKSNEKVFAFDRWRYEQEKPTHVSLEYRWVLQHSGGMETLRSGSRKLDEQGIRTIQDILTVAYNLGFVCNTNDSRLDQWALESVWKAGKPQVFQCDYKGQTVTLLEVKAHLNRNIHIRLNQKFALALNVEFGRLKGWLHSKEQAAEELQEPQAGQYFKTHLNCIGLNNPLLIADNTQQPVQETLF